MGLTLRLASPAAWLVVAAWVLLVVTELAGVSAAAEHHALLEGGELPWPSALLVFVLLWLVMVAAMMLPMNLPMLDAFLGVGSGGPFRLRSASAFFFGYSAVWTLFGVAAFAGDAGLHALSHSWHFLHEHEWLVLASAIGVAGAYQLSPSKRRSLEDCRSKTSHVVGSPNGGWTGAFAQGLRYGKSELACCWGLMLLAVAIGHSLLTMAFLTAMMLAEKTSPQGNLTVAVTGAALVTAAGAFVLLNV